MYQSINSQNITANEELIVNLFEAIDSSDFKLLVKYFDKNIIYQRPGYHDLIGIDKLLHFYQYDRITESLYLVNILLNILLSQRSMVHAGDSLLAYIKMALSLMRVLLMCTFLKTIKLKLGEATFLDQQSSGQ
jgi:hypothetical protein